MAYVEPDTILRFHEDVPLDPTQNHTLYFSTHTQQVAYFDTVVRHRIDRNTYQRVERGRIRVGLKAAQLYNCNYCSFRNAAYGTKWFYAFITAVEYVNDNTSDVFFEIDPIQTWLFEFEVGQCIIEREHPVSDRIGEHILPEPVELGEYVFNDYSVAWSARVNAVMIMYVDVTGASKGTIYGRAYSGVKLRVFNLEDVVGIDAFLNKYYQNPDSILNIYMVPENFIDVKNTGVIPDGGLDIIDYQGAYNSDYSAKAISNADFIDSYKPRNNKLYTYPYNFYNVDNGGAESCAFRYEFFEDLRPTFKLYGSLLPPVTLAMRATKYKGVEGDNNPNNTETVTLGNFPLCSWNIDSFKAWMSQSCLPSLVPVVGAAATAAVNPIGALAALGATANFLTQGYKASISADVCKGSTNNGSALYANGRHGIYAGRMSVSTAYARQIDWFFDVYGYNVQRLGKPLLNSRPHWNYIKTRNCVITGSVPADDARAICAAFDRGITYWAKASEVGRYNLGNQPG